MAAAIPLVLGGISAIKGQSDARKAANSAAEAAKNAQVNIPQVSQMATDQALKNIALSRQVEQQYDPQNAQLRQDSIIGLLAQLNQGDPNAAIKAGLTDQLQNGASTYGGSANSQLLQDAVAKAQSDLALNGSLPLDVRNLVARTAAGRSAGASNGLGLGRDIMARDLGLTSLDLSQRRLANAQALGQLDQGAAQFNQSQLQQANQFGANNNLNLASLLASLNGQDFSRSLAAAQFGQTLQSPTVGLDPSSIANLAVGNQNAATQAAMNAAGIKAQSANNLTNFGGQLFGYGFGNLGNVFGSSGSIFGSKPNSGDWNPYGASTATSTFKS